MLNSRARLKSIPSFCTRKSKQLHFHRPTSPSRWWWCRASCPRMSADILGTNCDQRRSTVQCCFTSTETVRLIRTESPGRPPRLSHSSWTLKSTTAGHPRKRRRREENIPSGQSSGPPAPPPTHTPPRGIVIVSFWLAGAAGVIVLIYFSWMQLTVLSKCLLVWCNFLFWANIFYFAATYYFGQIISLTWMQLTILRKYLLAGCSLLFRPNTF